MGGVYKMWVRCNIYINTLYMICSKRFLRDIHSHNSTTFYALINRRGCHVICDSRKDSI